MSDGELPELPRADGRIRVERVPDGLRIQLDRVRRRQRILDLLYLLVGVPLALASIWYLVRSAEWLAVSGLILVPAALLGFVGYNAYCHFVSFIVTVSADHLLIEIKRPWWETRCSLERRDIQAIAAWRGLRFLIDQQVVCWLNAWKLRDLDWLARVLRQHWDIPEHLDLEPGELLVCYTGTYWDTPVTGALRALTGRLRLRHPLDKPHLAFQPGQPDRLRLLQLRAVPLAGSDVMCRIEQDGSACVQIAPEGLRCADEGPHGATMFLRMVGPILHNFFILPAGTMLKRKLKRSERDFQLTLWCEDGTGLQQALARFWGSTED